MSRSTPLRTVARLALAGLFLVPAALPAASCAPVERDFGASTASTSSASGPCETGASCYTGPEGTEGVGACRAGSQVCDGDGYGACEGEILPAVDDCTTPEDEDCDGVAARCPLSTVWARGFLGIYPEGLPRIAVDGEGNVIVVGKFRNTIDFGDGDPLTASIEYAPFIVKLDPEGNVLWSRKISGTGESTIRGLALDVTDRILVTGDFNGEAIFDDTVLTSNQNTTDIFLARFASETGNVDWAYGFGGAGYDNPTGLTVDANGNPVLIGTFSDTLAFGSVSMTTQGNFEAFLAKMSPEGVFGIYARQFSSTGGTVDFSGVAPDRAGGVLVGGRFTGDVTFSDGNTLNSLGQSDGVLARLNSTGTALASRGLGGMGSDRVYDIAGTAENGWVTVGTFEDFADFGGDALEAVMGSSFFVAAYDSSGAHRFSLSFGENELSDHVAALDVDASGNTVVTGYFNHTLVFGDVTYQVQGTPGDDVDAFVLKLDSAGQLVESRAIGSTKVEGAFDVAHDPSGAPVIVGISLGGELDLGTGPLPADPAIPTLFIAKLAP
ncbi:hypothetical protein [Chondromyces apiculatus]|nr:hypothetical protein [Chondromyces apiculatus]